MSIFVFRTTNGKINKKKKEKTNQDQDENVSRRRTRQAERDREHILTDTIGSSNKLCIMHEGISDVSDLWSLREIRDS